ncbi:helix-turn-helix domain-containing protein [Streptomyces heilongjiangensis]|uniref:Helix-turn-helix domain-containing protein n=1 Tax=Streptomyces heilongjiangensis TaxID=945052 RepID=A0ABW1BKG2_9ACTN|nr:helix-turn-helix domain-containing protein [Streptomyces heilongjiangensis]MDC2952448.1 helix-turn-helix domain-containing protein [Streptomyces heilongjiangensis]
MADRQAGRDELVYGYLDTTASQARRALDTVRVRLLEHPGQVLLRPRRLGSVPTCEISGAGRAWVRSRRRPPTAGAGHLLGVALSGRGWLEQQGRRVPLDPGGFVLYDGALPFQLSLAGPYRYFLLHFAPGTFRTLTPADLCVPPGEETALVPSARLLSAMLAELASQVERLETVTGQEVAEHVAALVETVLRERARAGYAREVPPLFRRVLLHIDQHLADSALGPESIAQAHHISVRSLHKLFQAQDRSVLGHVRHQRLRQIRRDLADPTLAQVPVRHLAARWGMHDASHFSKVFRVAHGMSPSAFRRNALRPATGPERRPEDE